MKGRYSIIVISLFFCIPLSAQIFIEDFEGAMPNVLFTNGPCNDGAEDYFGVVCLNGAGCGNEISSNISFTNTAGSFLGAQDTNEPIACNMSSFVAALINDIDVSSCSGGDLYVCFQIAEDDASDGLEDWDSNSKVALTYDLDNSGNFNEIIAFESTSSSSENFPPSLDEDCDGVGDGNVFITETFTTFCVFIHGTGNLLDLRFNIENLNDGDEDVAIDNIEVYCTNNVNALPVTPTPTCYCPLSINQINGKDGFGVCNTFTGGVDTWDARVSFEGGNTDTYTITPNAGTVSNSCSTPNNSEEGSLLITGIPEGTDLNFTITSPNSCSVPIFVTSPTCTTCNNTPNGTVTFDIQMDMNTESAAQSAPTSFHNSIETTCGGAYNPVYGELDGNNGSGNVTGLMDEFGNSVSATYQVGDVDSNCPEAGLTSNINGGTISTASTMQGNSPKPTNLFSEHYTEAIGSFEGLNAVEITFTAPVNNFGIFLGDFESSSQGTLGKVLVFDNSNNLMASEELDPVTYGPINNESGCGFNQGNMNCGNGTTHWIGITNPSSGIKKVLMVIGDHDNCAQTGSSTGLAEHLSFGGVTVGGECIGPLPVTLIDFDGKIIDDNSIELSWSTESEVNNRHFEN